MSVFAGNNYIFLGVMFQSIYQGLLQSQGACEVWPLYFSHCTNYQAVLCGCLILEEKLVNHKTENQRVMVVTFVSFMISTAVGVKKNKMLGIRRASDCFHFQIAFHPAHPFESMY